MEEAIRAAAAVSSGNCHHLGVVCGSSSASLSMETMRRTSKVTIEASSAHWFSDLRMPQSEALADQRPAAVPVQEISDTSRENTGGDTARKWGSAPRPDWACIESLGGMSLGGARESGGRGQQGEAEPLPGLEKSLAWQQGQISNKRKWVGIRRRGKDVMAV